MGNLPTQQIAFPGENGNTGWPSLRGLQGLQDGAIM